MHRPQSTRALSAAHLMHAAFSIRALPSAHWVRESRLHSWRNAPPLGAACHPLGGIIGHHPGAVRHGAADLLAAGPLRSAANRTGRPLRCSRIRSTGRRLRRGRRFWVCSWSVPFVRVCCRCWRSPSGRRLGSAEQSLTAKAPRRGSADASLYVSVKSMPLCLPTFFKNFSSLARTRGHALQKNLCPREGILGI